MSAGDQCYICSASGPHEHVTSTGIYSHRPVGCCECACLRHSLAKLEEENKELRAKLKIHIEAHHYLLEQMESCEIHSGARRACGQCYSSLKAHFDDLKKKLEELTMGYPYER